MSCSPKRTQINHDTRPLPKRLPKGIDNKDNVDNNKDGNGGGGNNGDIDGESGCAGEINRYGVVVVVGGACLTMSGGGPTMS